MKASFKVLDYMCIDRFDGKIAADISNNNLYVLLNIFNFSINLLFTWIIELIQNEDCYNAVSDSVKLKNCSATCENQYGKVDRSQRPTSILETIEKMRIVCQ